MFLIILCEANAAWEQLVVLTCLSSLQFASTVTRTGSKVSTLKRTILQRISLWMDLAILPKWILVSSKLIESVCAEWRGKGDHEGSTFIDGCRRDRLGGGASLRGN